MDFRQLKRQLASQSKEVKFGPFFARKKAIKFFKRRSRGQVRPSGLMTRRCRTRVAKNSELEEMKSGEVMKKDLESPV